MDNSEQQWDKLLKIKTGGRDDSHATAFQFPYEPTPYPVLERLASKGYIGKRDVLIDYGCGKGRVSFFLSYQTRCRSIGVECERSIYDRALSNKETGVSSGRIDLVLSRAEDYPIPEDATAFYFFNPFSDVILRKVLKNILKAENKTGQDRYLFFYYPSPEYCVCLQNTYGLERIDIISCADLFDGSDGMERIEVWKGSLFD